MFNEFACGPAITSSQSSNGSDGTNPRKRRTIVLDSDDSDNDEAMSNGASISNNSSFQSTSTNSSEYHIPKKSNVATHDFDDIEESDGMLTIFFRTTKFTDLLNLRFLLLQVIIV